MTRDTKVQLAATVALITCLLASMTLATGLTALQGREKLVATDRAEEGQPWEVSAGIAMGAFRGIFVNALWIRANAMKEAGKFFDAIELASAITKLQPRFPRVWVFHAWNMAYNISVMTQTSEERWNWVNAGIRILRDKAIPANPNDILLHKELGWIFLHKIGGFTDDANAYYKRRLAMEWTGVLGPPPPRTPEDRDRDHRINVMADWLSLIADAPDSVEDLFAKDPAAGALADRIEALGFKLEGDSLLGRYEMHRASHDSMYRADYLAALKSKRTSADQPTPMEQLGELIDDAANEKAWKALLPTLRKRLLVDVYHMEPDRMVRYTRKYGPMDWRHHGAHALYWSARGVEEGLNRITKDNRLDYDTLNTDRITVQAVQELFRTGEVYFDYFASMLGQYTVWIGAPDGHFVTTYGDIIDGEVRKRSRVDQLDNRGTTPLSAGYENFLRDSICFFYRRGDYKQATFWFDKLRNYEGLNFNNPLRKEEMALPLNEFVAKELNDRATSPNVAVAQVVGALIGAYTSGLLAGDEALFTSQMEYAKQAHKYFMQEQRKAVVVNKQNVRMDQMEPDFRVQAGIILVNALQSLSIDDASILYGRCPNDLKQFAYDALAARFKDDMDAHAKQSGSATFEKTFPEPSGMAQFRESFKHYAEARGKGELEVELK